MLLLLDLDNTLVDRDRAFTTWAKRFLAEIGGGAKDLEWMLAADANGYAPRQGVAERIRARFELADPVSRIVERLLYDHVELIECYPGVISKLKEFRAAGDQLVVVTNGTSIQQSKKIIRAGLSDFIDGAVISETVGIKKPHPGIFAEALRYRADNSAVWMVGDNPDADIRGAQGYGILTGWVSHHAEWNGPQPPTVMRATTELVLAEIQLRRR
ncbi:MAG: HAD family hydrolase [Salinibacterium amurskyense]